MKGETKNIIIKELKELFRDPKIIVPMIIIPLVIFPLMGSIMSGMMEETTKISAVKVCVIDNDRGNYSSDLVAYIQSHNISPVNLTAMGISDILKAYDYAKEHKIQTIMVIPENFSANISAQIIGTVELYAVFDGFGTLFSNEYSIVSGVVTEYISYLSYVIINSTGTINATFAQNPVNVTEYSINQGKIVAYPPYILVTLLYSQTFSVPFAFMMLVMLSIQMASTSVAAEKEAKTLETLLSLPVKRISIVIGKMVGTIIISAIGALVFTLSFSFYMGCIPSYININPEEVGFSIEPIGYIFLIVCLFLALIILLSLAMILASFAEDVRGAQALIGILQLPVVVGYILSIFIVGTITSPAVISALLAVPFFTPLILPQILILRQYSLVITAVVILIIETIIAFYAAAKLYGSEKLLTLRLRFGKRKRALTQ